MKLYRDAVDSNYLYLNGYLSTLSIKRKNSLIGKNLFTRFKVQISLLIKEFFNLFKRNTPISLDNKIVCIINSTNNFESLKFLKSNEVIFIKFTSSGSKIPGVVHYIFRAKFFYSLFFILISPYILLKKRNRDIYILLHRSFGVSYLFKRIITNNRPKKIIVANDHIPEIRSIIIAAKEMGIHTTYIQHGVVSKYFPPIIFDDALIESLYSYDTYNHIKKINKSNVFLIGIPRIDKHINPQNKRSVIKTIGVAVNQNDEFDIINKVVVELSKYYRVILRNHPADKRSFLFDKSIYLQYANDTDVFDFIDQIDFLVASDSSIHVEANSLFCRSVYMMMHTNLNKRDYYNFVSNHFIDSVNTIEELITYIKRFDYSSFDFFSKELSYYNSALNPELYGKSSIIAKKIIYENINL